MSTADDQVYYSSRETFGISSNLKFLIKVNTSQYQIDKVSPIYIPTSVRVGIAFPYVIWAGFGTMSNLLVILLIIFNRKMHGTFKLLLLNLAVADIIVTGIVVPILGSWQALHYPVWQYSKLTCKALNFSAHVGGLVAGTTLAVIAVFRFLAVKYSKKFVLNYRWLIGSVLFIWSIGILGSIGALQKADVVQMIIKGNIYRLCLMVHRKQIEEKKELSFRVSVYVLSSLFLLVLYSVTIVQLRRSRVSGLHSVSGREHESAKNKKQAVYMMAVATIALIVCYIPYMTLVTINIFAPQGFFSATSGIEIFTNIIVSFNSVIDPLIYCAFSSQIRAAFKETFLKTEGKEIGSITKQSNLATSVGKTS